MNFTDIHSHILPGLDDGAPDEEAAVSMLKMAYEDGTNNIILTPHYITGSFENARQIVEQAVHRMREMIKAEGMKMEVYPGSEIYLDMNTASIVQNGTVATLNGSRYLLVELPANEVPVYAGKIFFELALNGYVPIIAHPERNNEMIRKPQLLKEYVEKGVLVQINSCSLAGLYGKRIREAAYGFLKMGLVHFVATDTHSMRGRKPLLNEVYGSVESRFGTSYARRIFSENGLSVIKNEDIDPVNIVKEKTLKKYIPLISRIKSIF